jgi:hypothetical protein
MDISYYKIAEVYKKDILLKEFTNSPEMDVKNSYQTTASMMGPGHGPTHANDTDMAQFGDRVAFPEDNEELSNVEKSQLLISFLKKEIDEGTWDEKTKYMFSHLLSHLLGEEELGDESDSDSEEK